MIHEDSKNSFSSRRISKYDFLKLSERIEIERYFNSGFPCDEIAKILNRGKATIAREIRGCERGKYDATEAQKKADARNLERIKKISLANKSGNWSDFPKNARANMRTRIENLEMQVEILIDEIKFLRSKIVDD